MEGPAEKSGAGIPEDARHALDKFKEEARAVADEVLKPVGNSPHSQIVYHYTNDIGLQGILHSGKVWLTDAFSLNDPSELFHGIELIRRSGVEEGIEPRKVLDGDPDRLKTAFQETAHYFCCSFSEAGDDLGQWRAYADNGKGYAVGFDWQKLEEAFSEKSAANFLVSYNEQDLRRGIERIFESYDALVAAHPGIEFQEEEDGEFGRRVRKALARPIIRMSLHYKHPAYRNEAEYRFLKIQKLSDLDGILFRPRNYELIKYKEFDWRSAGSNVLKKIVVGPAANFEKSSRFAKDCLRKAGIDLNDDAITQSQIPYKPV